MMNSCPRIPLAEVLTPISRAERVDPEKTYRVLGAHWYAAGLYVKDTLLGSEIRADKVFRVEEGDFVYNRLFAWKGSFAVATDANAGCYVSNEFPYFAVNRDRADPKFLWRYFSRVSAWEEALGLSTGGTPTSRNRLKEEKFLAMEIPLPLLSEQRRIIARIEELAAKINEAQKIRVEIEKEQNLLLSSAFHRIAVNSPRHPLGEIAPLTRRAVRIDPEKEYPQIAVRSFGKGTFHKPPLVGSDVTWQKPFLVRAGDILIGNIKAWEGAIAVAANGDDGRVGSHRYLTCMPRPSVATARFVCFYLLTPEGLYHVGEASPGSADRNRTLSSKALLQIPVPIPDYERQLWFDSLYKRVDLLRILQAKTTVEMDALLSSMLDKALGGGL